MSINYKSLINVSFVIILASGLVACGGSGSSTTESTDTNSTSPSNTESTIPTTSDSTPSSTSGNTTVPENNPNISNKCVTIPRAKAGRRTVHNSDGTSAGTVIVTNFVEEVITAISNTSFSTRITERQGTRDGTIISKADLTQIFTIDNNVKKVTKETSHTLSTTPNSEEITATMIREFSPYRSEPVDKVCENQTWTSNHTTKMTTTTPSPTGGEDRVTVTEGSETASIVNTTELINVQKTVPAGTFTTVRYKVEFKNDNLFIIGWIDVTTGIIVALNFYGTSGDVVGTRELVSFSVE